MLNRNILLLGMCAILALASCDRQGKELNEIKAQSAQMDSILRINPVLKVTDKAKAEELIMEYREYVRNYPNDTLCPGFLLKSALLFNAIPEYKSALEVIDQLVAQYPESDEAQQGLAIGARIAEDYIKDYNLARSYYTTIKEKYPNGPYGVNIDLQIEHVGDPEGLLQAIMEKNGMVMDTLSGSSVNVVK